MYYYYSSGYIMKKQYLVIFVLIIFKYKTISCCHYNRTPSSAITKNNTKHGVIIITLITITSASIYDNGIAMVINGLNELCDRLSPTPAYPTKPKRKRVRKIRL